MATPQLKDYCFLCTRIGGLLLILGPLHFRSTCTYFPSMDQFGRPILLLPYALDSLEEQFVWFFFFFSQIIHIFWHNSTFWTTSVKCLLLAVWSIWTTITNSNTSQWMLMIFLQCDSDGVCVWSHFRNLPLTIPEILCLHNTHDIFISLTWKYLKKSLTIFYEIWYILV